MSNYLFFWNFWITGIHSSGNYLQGRAYMWAFWQLMLCVGHSCNSAPSKSRFLTGIKASDINSDMQASKEFCCWLGNGAVHKVCPLRNKMFLQRCSGVQKPVPVHPRPGHTCPSLAHARTTLVITVLLIIFSPNCFQLLFDINIYVCKNSCSSLINCVLT